MDSPVISTSDGKIQGKLSEDFDGGKFYSFLGVPYAKPPVGELRFKAPQPIDPWNGIKDATKDGEPCYQRTEFTNVLEGSEENCLHLNIYTKTLPSEEQKLKPVLAWIYGGAFLHGSNRSTLYGPEYLMTEDVVVVAINYRLGFLGFLHLNDQSLDVPGNAGLKDQQLGLKWIQKNIKHFNGDPDNVTIFGESAGSASVHYQVVSPSSKGLFHKAIMQSGTLHSPWPYSRDVALEFAKSINPNVKNEKEALEILKKLSVKDLYIHQENFIENSGTFGICAPNVEYPNETAFITAPPTQLLASGKYNKVPIMLGYTNREGLLIEATNNIRKAFGKNPSPALGLEALVHPFLNLKPDDPKVQLITKKYKEFYLQGENAKDKVMLLTDYIFFIGVIASATQHVKTSGQPVFLYRMSLDAGMNVFKKLSKLDEPGACHADDLGYLFNMPLAAGLLEKGPVEEKAMRSFVKLWTNFARCGNPTPDGNSLNVTWKPISGKEMDYLDINKTLKPLRNPEAERVEFWRDIFKLSPFTAGFLE